MAVVTRRLPLVSVSPTAGSAGRRFFLYVNGAGPSEPPVDLGEVAVCPTSWGGWDVAWGASGHTWGCEPDTPPADGVRARRLPLFCRVSPYTRAAAKLPLFAFA
jgi:hypothetical protein